MERALALLRGNPGLLACVIFASVASVLFLGFALMMSRSGLSLRPLVFLAGFFVLIVGPQLLYHVLRAQGRLPELTWVSTSHAPAWREDETALAVRDHRFLHPDLVFGPGHDSSLLTDVRRLFSQPIPEAAQLAVFPNAQSTIAARFASPEEAWAGFRFYAAAIGAEPTQPEPDGVYVFQRAGDWVGLAVVGRTLFAWSSASRDGLATRREGSAHAWSEPDTSSPAPVSPAVHRRFAWAALLGLLALTVLWFFKGSAWAVTVSPEPRAGAPLAESELRERLLGLPEKSSPLTLAPGKDVSEVVVTWSRDAAWVDAGGAEAVHRFHKLVLRLDAEHHVVRVKEYAASGRAAASASGAELRWESQWGFVFFERSRQRSLGAQAVVHRDRTGVGPRLDLDFDLQDLKLPVKAVVLDAGWTWKPVLFDPPRPFRGWFE